MNGVACCMTAVLTTVLLLAQSGSVLALEPVAALHQPDAVPSQHQLKGLSLGHAELAPPPSKGSPPPKPPANPPATKPPATSPPAPHPSPVPAKTGQFASESKLNHHFKKHGTEVGARTPAEYQHMANTLLNGPLRPGVVERVLPSGRTVRLDTTTQAYGEKTRDGTIRTYHKADPAVHGYPSNLDYLNSR